ncbi:MAG TPA: hypothetical protein VHK69_08070 [Chitinophagaceae bacterium]|jgi:hypothetical protein|nr:hypothetical protein [Chitinophagaceae bacterium]
MDERQPYDDLLRDRMSDLPVPDMEPAWEDMKRRLEKDKRRRWLPPFFWGCAGMALLGAAGWALIWLFFFRPGADRQTAAARPRQEQHSRPVLPATPPEAARKHLPQPGPAAPDASRGKESSGTATGVPAAGKEPTADGPQMSVAPGKTPVPPGRTRAGSKRPADTPAARTRRGMKQVKKGITTKTQPLPVPASPGDPADTTRSAPPLTSVPGPDSPVTAAVPKEALPQKAADSSDQKAKEATPPPRPRWAFSAGLSVAQQIPLNGQTAVPYSAYGRKGSITDYLPAVYFRAQRNRIFLQGGFRYGAPQQVKEITYSQQTVLDTFSGQLTHTSLRVKKTFYHQVPLSLHYRVTDRWSAGLGLVYNRFYGAVREEEVRSQRINAPADSAVSSKILPVQRQADSNFVRSHLYLMAETEYQWKRWGFGLRYQLGLQPYLRYTDPAGLLREEKNRNLQVFLRFRLKEWLK